MSYKPNLVFEPIEIITYHALEEMIILKYKWKNRVYRISRQNSKWIEPTKDFFTTHFTIICNHDMIIAELCYYHKELKWELIQWDRLQ